MGNGWVEKELKDTYRGLSRQIISTISSPKYGVGIPKNVYSPEAAKSRFSQSWVTGAWKPLTFCHNSLKLGCLWGSGGVSTLQDLLHFFIPKEYFWAMEKNNSHHTWIRTEKTYLWEYLFSWVLDGCCLHTQMGLSGRLKKPGSMKGQMLGFVNTQFPSYDLHSFKKKIALGTIGLGHSFNYIPLI